MTEIQKLEMGSLLRSDPVVVEIVETMLESVDWTSPTAGFCKCPGQGLHNQRNGARDCKFYVDNVPTLACFHSSCRKKIEETNRALREAIRAGVPGQAGRPRTLTAEDRERMELLNQRECLRRRAAISRSLILAQHRWTYAEIQAASPMELAEPREQWRLLLKRFEPQDVVWVGDTRDSGTRDCRSHFRTVEQWCQEPQAPAQFTCPATFQPGSYSRSNANVLAKRFLVVESDELSKDEVGAVMRWLHKKVGMKLEAIVDTAGKSLHAWFQYPAEDLLGELKIALPELGCDPKLFTASQPVRLPGAMREGKTQRLVYLARKEVL